MGAGLREGECRTKCIGWGEAGSRGKVGRIGWGGAVAHEPLHLRGFGGPGLALEIGTDEGMDVHCLARLEAKARCFQPKLVGEGGREVAEADDGGNRSQAEHWLSKNKQNPRGMRTRKA